MTKQNEAEVEINGEKHSISADMIKRGTRLATKYLGEEHCILATEVLEQMHSLKGVAASLDVHISTLYDWMDKYPQFNDAIVRGRQRGETRFEKKAIDNFENKNFNAVAWQMYGRRVYGYTETRLVKIPGYGINKDGKPMNTEEELTWILQNISDGVLTPKEGNEMANIVAAKAKTYEQVEAKKLLEEIAKTLEKK